MGHGNDVLALVTQHQLTEGGNPALHHVFLGLCRVQQEVDLLAGQVADHTAFGIAVVAFLETAQFFGQRQPQVMPDEFRRFRCAAKRR